MRLISIFAGMNSNMKSLMELNLATLILGSSGLLGKLIHLPPPFIIFARSFIAYFFIRLILKLTHSNHSVSFKKNRLFFLLSGFFLAAHWVFYFFALEVSTVSIAFISVFTFPVITTLIEPFFFRSRLSSINLLSAMAVLVGIYILLPGFDLQNNTTLGVVLGVLSALFYALRNLMNKQYIHIFSGTDIMSVQLLVTSVLLSPTVFLYKLDMQYDSIIFLILLGVVTTAIGHTLFVRSLRNFKTSTASIITSMQPIYGIILAVIILGEKLTTKTIIGGILIITTVFFESLQQYLKKN